jgi:hypothetical protein
LDCSNVRKSNKFRFATIPFYQIASVFPPAPLW